MQKKRTTAAPPKERHSHHLRFNDAEQAALDADRKSLPGIPPKPGAYLKHAALSYPALRLLEASVRHYLNSQTPEFRDGQKLARELLETAGLPVNP